MYFSGGPTDLSKSYEFTDWKEVDRFANESLNQIFSEFSGLYA